MSILLDYFKNKNQVHFVKHNNVGANNNLLSKYKLNFDGLIKKIRNIKASDAQKNGAKRTISMEEFFKAKSKFKGDMVGFANWLKYYDFNKKQNPNLVYKLSKTQLVKSM